MFIDKQGVLLIFGIFQVLKTMSKIDINNRNLEKVIQIKNSYKLELKSYKVNKLYQ